MTNQMTHIANSLATTTPHSTTHASTVRRATVLIAFVGGAAWVIDTVTIAVLDRAFDPLDSVLFFVGLGCLVLTVVAVATRLSAGHRGRARLGRAAVALLAVTALLGSVSLAADTLGRRLFSPANVGLHEEWSCFSVGLCMLAIAGWAAVEGRRG